MTTSVTVRSESLYSEEIRKKALKCGATSVSTRDTTNPNQEETVATFRRAADKKTFGTWVTKKFKGKQG